MLDNREFIQYLLSKSPQVHSITSDKSVKSLRAEFKEIIVVHE